MKKTMMFVVGGLALALTIGSCSQPAPMDPAKMQAKADSVVNAKMSAVMDSMNMDCAKRMNTEVQAKCDSICKANGVNM